MTGNYSKEVVEEAIDRLAAYEDTGLEPEEIVVQEVLVPQPYRSVDSA